MLRDESKAPLERASRGSRARGRWRMSRRWPPALAVLLGLTLTGSAAEVIPVVTIDGRQIGDGKAGKTTLDLLAKFRALTREE